MFHRKPVKRNAPRKRGVFFAARTGGDSNLQIANSQTAKRLRSRGTFSAPRRRSHFPFLQRGVERREAPERLRDALDGASGSAGTLAKRSASPNVREKRRLRALHPRRRVPAARDCVGEYIPSMGEVNNFIAKRFFTYGPAYTGDILGLLEIRGIQAAHLPDRSADASPCLE
jgi:hypothetical protein